MNYIEVYKEQLNNNTTENELYKSSLFREYFALNCFLNSFELTDERLTELICDDINLLTNEDILRLNQSIQIIKDGVHELVTRQNILFTDYAIDGIVFLLGDKTIDSHGIMIKDKTYLIIDLLTYSTALENYNPISFLVHEIIHSIHYKLNPDMYFRNFRSQSESIIKRLIVEGVATYATKFLTNETDEDVFWLGYLNEEEVYKWKAYSTETKGKFSVPLSELILTGTWTDNYQYEFFSITDPEKLWKGRLAYYYGYEIVSNLSKGRNLDDVLKLCFSDYMDEIKTYFSLKNTV